MANKKNSKKKSKKKLLILLIAFVLIAGGGYTGYSKYMAYQKHLAEQKAKEEELRKKQMEEEQKKKELEQAKQKFSELIALMRQELAKKNYARVRELADQARKLALAYNLPADEIDKILYEMNLAIASAKLSRLEKIHDVYAHSYLRNQLKTIPRYPEIAARWDRLLRKTYQDEYTVLLELAALTSKKTVDGDTPDVNYKLSKTYLKKAKLLVASGKAKPDVSKENSLLESQSEGYMSSIGRSFQPINLYR